VHTDRQHGRLIVVGRIAAPFGVRGWVKAQPFARESTGLLESGVWHLERYGRSDGVHEIRVLEAAQHGKAVIARLDGIADRDQAAALVGMQISVPSSLLPAIGEGEYYWADLVGLKVVNREGDALGAVTGLLETGANDVLVVQDGDVERLLPMVGTVIDGIDLAAREIRVDWGRDWGLEA
jgi:16S rRNA processing protein RimM